MDREEKGGRLMSPLGRDTDCAYRRLGCQSQRGEKSGDVSGGFENDMG
jgi:hypothetical protein